MKIISCWTMATAAVLALSVTSYAENLFDGEPYVKIDAGGNFAQDVEIQDSFGVKMNLDTGFRGDVAFGYHINECSAVELQTGFLGNSVDSFNNVDLRRSEGDLYQFPLMINGIYSIPLKYNIKPYVGIGVGAVFTTLDFETPLTDFTDNDISDNDLTFGYQAMAGVLMELTECVDLGLTYKFLGTTEHEFNDVGRTLKTDGILNHAILATISFRF